MIRQFVVINSIHGIDLLRYLGGDATEICASASATVRPDMIDMVNALVRFRSGVTGIVTSYHQVPAGKSPELSFGGERTELWGHGISAWVEDGHSSMTVWRPDQSPESIRARGEVADWGGTRGQDQFFIDCLREGKRVNYPGSDLADAVKTMELVEVIRNSLKHPGLEGTRLSS